MAKKYLTNVTLVLPHKELQQSLLITSNGRIESTHADTPDLEPDTEIIDGNGCFAFPGMVDVLTHGYGPHLYCDADPNCISDNSETLGKHGVTAFSPSITSMPLEEHIQTLAALSDNIRQPGARVLGLHSEGPCFGSPGAHNKDNLINPSAKLANRMLDACNGNLAFVTLAPELEGSAEFCKIMRENEVGLHIGHSCAPPADVPRYADMGITCATHLYDVPGPIPERKDGLTTVSLPDALIAEPRIALAVICDGVHVDPIHIRLLAQLPEDRLVLETDSMKFAGVEEGRFELYDGCWVTVRDDDAGRLDGGGLAGSSLTSDRALRNLIEFTGMSFSRASHAASLNPARVAGRDHELGSLEVGKFADFTLLEPNTLEVTATYVGGQQVYAG